jgi:hypothetical protein
MPFVSITRLRVRGWSYMLQFLWHTVASQRQVKRSPGFMQGALSTAQGRVFWTATVWSDEASMKRFRDAGGHKKAMPRLLDICDEASLAHWTQDSGAVPDAPAMLERMQAIGRTSKVRHPTPEHRAGATVPDGRPPRPSRPFGPS